MQFAALLRSSFTSSMSPPAAPPPEEDFEKLPPSTVPEMQRTNLAPVILQLKALGIDNVLRFSFLSVSRFCCTLALWKQQLQLFFCKLQRTKFEYHEKEWNHERKHRV